MISRLLEVVLRLRVVILAALAIGIVASLYAMTRAPLDAIPDISDPQVVVYVKWPRSAQLIESEVTGPLIQALSGAPGIQSLRGASHMGYSFIYVILDDGAQRARIRQLVADRITALRPQLPPDALVTLGPNASSMGWIYQYAIVDREKLHDLRELRLLNESQIKPALQGVAGVAEVASVGGLEKQYQVKVFPPLLATSGVSLRQVIDALQSVFQEVGGRTIEVTNREYQLRGAIATGDVDQLQHLVVGRSTDGAAIQLKDVGYVQVGYDLRRSTADLDGEGEVVGGIAIMEQDQNVLAVTRAIDERLSAVRANLPAGVEILTTYDRSAWIWATLQQFFATLGAELVVLILVTVLFLGELRSAVGPIAILLLSTLFTVLPLAAFDQTINLFSLAGLCIAIGAIEDATIVIVENCASELSAQVNLDRRQRRRVILQSIARVARPLLFSLLIIVASFLPVFFLEAREARLFDPLAYSKTFAVAVSTLLTILLLPIVMVWVFDRDGRRIGGTSASERSSRVPFTRHRFTIAGALLAVVIALAALAGRVVGPELRPELLQLSGFVAAIVLVWALMRRSEASQHYRETRPVRIYASLLQRAIRYRYPFTAAGLMVVIAAVVTLRQFQRDFLPDIDEGPLLYMPTTLPGLPTREAGWVVQQMDKKLKAIPEVERVFAKLGRADTSTDPAPVSMIETTILLKPRSAWRPGMTKQKLVGEMDAAMQIVGYVNAWVQPIRARVMMQTTGIQTPVGLKVKGPEVGTVEEIAQKVESLLRDVPGTKYVLAERISEGYYTDVRYDLARLAEHGVTADEALLTVRYGIGGDNVLGIKQPDGTVVPLAVQYSAEYLDTLEKVRNTPVVTSQGSPVPLSDVADVAIRKMPEMLRNDNGTLSGYVYVDIQDVTATDYVERARAHLASNLTMPPGYSFEWTGLYQYTTAASERLRVIVPLTLVIIFALLVMTFRSVTEAVLVAMSVPFALAGGVFLQWALGYAMTTAVVIGYISVFAVAVQTGIIMVIFIREALANRPPDQPFVDAVIEGSTARLRPKLMTVATIIQSFSLIPLSSGPGMEIMKPIAAPSIGGMVTSTLHVLFMTPCLFVIAEDVRRYWSRRRQAVMPSVEHPEARQAAGR
jgi:Cu(I)/Ag(I) efflux system membrane protein CusA/SilA